MLPALNRLTRREDFATAVRRGRRAARRTLVVHLAQSPLPQVSPAIGVSPSTPGLPSTPVAPPIRVAESDLPGLGMSEAKVSPRVGFIVGRPVGSAVVRHRVQRQLRHVMRSRLNLLPDGALVVVRAQPAAADAGSAALGDDLEAALRRLT